jgi:hypothetical protein
MLISLIKNEGKMSIFKKIKQFSEIKPNVENVKTKVFDSSLIINMSINEHVMYRKIVAS